MSGAQVGKRAGIARVWVQDLLSRRRLLLDPDAEVQRASAEALGNVGSVKAVEPLLPLAEGFGVARSCVRPRVARSAAFNPGWATWKRGASRWRVQPSSLRAVDLAGETRGVRAGALSLSEDADGDVEPRQSEAASRASSRDPASSA
jgi:hypothetical protein